ncbi:Octanoyltransferase LipM,Lipoate-protein ligase A,Biotin/lipoate A/B protein ligase family [Chlamydia serpentis]|uniref:Octanoyltransferase LipM,Lipoate-protein ligase A,Biotin/lipoate A/B protein ligase family n=1 Tax=Chlamydia serpentis TaxID=1967782 RepID=A0A2R8FB44_9CHLA|nr:lipoate--protein ligase family protein [Chlamydia serpentis]SPN73571.1 Octanoyltransferase LipM,Lipoate-protein ligase A,Biotin/lipoate A/B protein ligase family [Chlamydia serpentis]
MKIRIIDSGKSSAASHMAKDQDMLQNLKEGELILHLYEWESPYPLTYGYFMRPEKFLISNHKDLGLDAAVRPTGGGFVFHQGDYAFSVLMSATHPRYSPFVLENYHTVNSFVVKVLEKVFRIQSVLAPEDQISSSRVSGNFCMAKTSKYDVLIGGKKVGGAAQRKVNQGFLHQGSLFLSGSSPDFYQRFLNPDVFQEIIQQIETHAFFPLGRESPVDLVNQARQQVKEVFIKLFCCEGL